jgi:predicted acetylornithine/succinylornithine family transaminase
MHHNTSKTDTNKEIFEMGSKYLMPTYARLPVVFTKAKMQYLWDANGKGYLDFIAGYGCLNVGHSNPLVLAKIKKQIADIIQPSNVYFNKPQAELAKKLCEITGFGKKVFFSNSGTEAIEAAVKLARKYSKERYNVSRYRIISFYKSFHGRTLGALSATAQEEKQKVFEPLIEGFDYARINDIESVKKKISADTCAVLLEPIQGEGGINVAEKEFLSRLKDVCVQNNMLLILDEVQTGFGRTGKMFAFQNYGIVPDILVLAKSIGGGMPLGAIVAGEELSSAFTPGSHGSTFGGNAASCAAGCAVIDYILKKNLAEKAAKLGSFFINELKKMSRELPIIKEVRGMGLMVGLELAKPVASEIVSKALEDGLVINKVSPSILRFLPSLVINKSDLKILLGWMLENLGNF